MLDKAILIATNVYLASAGNIEVTTAPLNDMKVMTLYDCMQQRDSLNPDLAKITSDEKDKVDDKGRKTISASVQCYVVSPEDFAVFSLTYGAAE